jgi:hypothetical protein
MKSATIALVGAAGMFLLAACDNKSSPESPPGQSPVTAPAPAGAPAPSASLPRRRVITPNTEQGVYTVDSVMLAHPADAPKAIVITVRGVVRTGGWTNLRLVEVAGVDNRADIKSYKFVATSPAGAATAALQRAETVLRVDSLPAAVKTIRVVSETNEVSAAIPP